MEKKIKIGSRGSKLAMIQANMVRAALQQAHPDLTAEGRIEIVEITTSGDRIQDRSLMEAGGKGLFTKEIEEALLNGSIDLAVHSMKDMPTVLPKGLYIPCLLKREDPRDAFFSEKAQTLEELPAGSVVGTASLRRQAMVLANRPDLKVEVFRGNVDTRLNKLKSGVVDATLLALAGLNRMGISDLAQSVIDVDVFLPAVAQGAVGIEIRQEDAELAALLKPIHCPQTALRVAAERAYLYVMDGSCRTPIAGYASAPDNNGEMLLKAWVADPQGTDIYEDKMSAPVHTIDDAQKLGHDLGVKLRARLPEGFVYTG